jgi:hypothetical protein
MVDQSTGTWPSGYPDIFGIQLTRLGLAFTAMSDATRLAAITSGQVRWSGSNAVADNGGTEPLIYAPSPYESGSSMSHWDTSLSPDELMEPFYAGANHDPGLALAAFEDLGWSISGGPPPTGGPTTTITTTTTTTTLPLLDPFLCYKSKTTKKTPKFSPVLGVELVNTFETATTNIMKPKNLCNPSAVGTGPLLDVGTHLVAYTIASSPKHLPRPTVLITDQFGSFFVRTVKAERLLTPSAQSLTGPQLKLDPASHNVDNFKCYKVKLVKGSEKPYKKQQVTVTDEFTTAKAFIVKKPKRLCRPASMNGVGIKNTAANLICYAVKPAKNQPKTAKRKGIHTANELGVVQLDTKKEELVCLPAVTNVF